MFITTTIMVMFSQSSHYYITVQVEKASEKAKSFLLTVCILYIFSQNKRAITMKPTPP